MARLRLGIAATLAIVAFGVVRCGGSTSSSGSGASDAGGDEPDAAGCQCSDMKSLSCYCDEIWCPTYEAATECSGARVSVRAGCGFEWIQRGHPKWGYGYSLFMFEPGSHELLGAKSRSESPVGPCAKYEYQTDGFVPPCAEAAECILCGPTYDEVPPCAEAGVPDASLDGEAPDAEVACKDLDEQSCLQELAATGKCSPLHGAKVPGGSKQFVACRSFCAGGAVMSCGLDPSGTCWLFPDTCVPEGWTAVFECNPTAAPACAGAFDGGGLW